MARHQARALFLSMLIGGPTLAHGLDEVGAGAKVLRNPTEAVRRLNHDNTSTTPSWWPDHDNTSTTPSWWYTTSSTNGYVCQNSMPPAAAATDGMVALFELRMTDSYGDGWNGAYYHLVDAEGFSIASCTLEEGSYGTEVLSIPPGLYSFFLEPEGRYPEEITWEIVACQPGGECSNKPLFEGNASETAAIGVIPSPGDNQVVELQLLDSYGDGWNGAYYHVLDAQGNNITSGTLMDGHGRTEYLSLPPGLYTFFVDPKGGYPSEISWEMRACEREGECMDEPRFEGFASDTLAVAMLPPSPSACVDSANTAWAAQRCDELFFGTSHCNGAHLTRVANTCDDSGCKVAVGAQMMGRTCNEYCGVHGLSCAESRANDGLSCSLNTGVFELQLLDSYGDGWNGAYYHVFDAQGNNITSGTLMDGHNRTEYLSLPPGVYTFFVDPEGGWPEEITWEIRSCEREGECSYEPLFEGNVSDTADIEGAGAQLSQLFELQLLDSYGDGWNGAYYHVFDAQGNNITSGTLMDGHNRTEYLSLPPGVYNFFVDPEGGWPEEITWEMRACEREGECSYEPLFQGDFSDTATIMVGAQLLELQLLDSYGDGWNGAYYHVVDWEGNTITSGTVTNGYERVEYLSLPPGHYAFFVDPEGSWPEEISWEVRVCTNEDDCSSEPIFEGNFSDTNDVDLFHIFGGMEEGHTTCDTPLESEYAVCRCEGFYFNESAPTMLQHQDKWMAKQCLKVAHNLETCMKAFGYSDFVHERTFAELMDKIGAAQCVRRPRSLVESSLKDTGLEAVSCGI